MTAEQRLTQSARLAQINKELDEVDAALEVAPDLDTYDALTARRGQLLGKRNQIKNGKGYGRTA